MSYTFTRAAFRATPKLPTRLMDLPTVGKVAFPMAAECIHACAR